MNSRRTIRRTSRCVTRQPSTLCGISCQELLLVASGGVSVEHALASDFERILQTVAKTKPTHRREVFNYRLDVRLPVRLPVGLTPIAQLDHLSVHSCSLKNGNLDELGDFRTFFLAWSALFWLLASDEDQELFK